MRFKRLLAGLMAFVLSLNLVHINVNAETNSKTSSKTNFITNIFKRESDKEEATKDDSESITDVALEKISDKILRILFKVGKFVIKKLWVGIEYIVIGVCIGIGVKIVKEVTPEEGLLSVFSSDDDVF